MAAVEKKKAGGQPGNKGGQGARAGVQLTKALGQRICKHIETGTPKRFAARAEGVSENTVAEWVSRGEGRDPDRAATPLMEWFAKEMRKAEAKDVNRRKVRLDSIAESGDPRVDMWWLERRHPEEFGRVDRHEVTGEGGGPVTIRVAFDVTPIPARPRAALGGPVIDVDAVEES